MSNSSHSAAGALGGIAVLDCTQGLGEYCGRLLAALGADVVRVTDSAEMRTDRPDARALFFGIGKQSVVLDSRDDAGRRRLDAMIERAEVILEGGEGSILRRCAIDPANIRAANPRAVHVRMTPYGADGPDAGARASDLTLLARGGLMRMAGEPGRPPVRAAGWQSEIATGLAGAVGALIALWDAGESRAGQVVDVAAIEVIATALENAVQFFDLEGRIRQRTGARPVEAGTGLFPCSDGFVFMMAGRLSTPRGWSSIVEWLNEAAIPGAQVLTQPEWADYEYRTRPESTRSFNALFESFAAARSKHELYEEGQRRGIVICPVNEPLELLRDIQLESRRFFVDAPAWPGAPRNARIPSRPFVMSATPVRSDNAGVAASDPETRWSPRKHDRARDQPRKLPLAGIRVADFTWFGAGPFATKTLADFGADVIKIESASRLDSLRTTPPYRDGVAGINRSGYFANRNTSKKSLALNLGTARGRELARALISQCDVVANSFTPGTMEKWGLAYEDCRALRSDIIYLSMPMHGADGPHRAFLGYGSAMGALSGLLGATGYPGTPTGTGTNYPDHVPNPGHGTLALLAALHHRRRTGQGQAIEVSQVESTIFALGPLLLDAQLEAAGGRPLAWPRGNAERGVAPHGVYRAKGEDAWIALACWNEDEWRRLCRIANRDWDADPRFATVAAREAHAAALDAAIEAWSADHDPHELSARLQRERLDAAAVQSVEDLIKSDPQLRHLGHWVRLDHPEMRASLYNGVPIHLSRTPGALRSAAPLLGEHTQEICTSLLGLTTSDVAALRDARVLA